MTEEVTTGTEAPATPTEPSPLQQELALAKEEMAKVRTEAEQQKFVNQRQRIENDQNRRSMETLRGQLTEQGYQEPEETKENRMQGQLDAQADEMGLMRFKLENPEWKKNWDEMQNIFNDPSKAEEVAVFDRNADGRAVPNMFKSLSNALTRVEIAQLRELKAKTEEAKAGRADGQEVAKGQAHISGVSASEAEQVIDIRDPKNTDGSPMSSDDMIRAGLVDMDPRDPVKERHPKQ